LVISAPCIGKFDIEKWIQESGRYRVLMSSNRYPALLRSQEYDDEYSSF
jgi:hypothetical protein